MSSSHYVYSCCCCCFWCCCSFYIYKTEMKPSTIVVSSVKCYKRRRNGEDSIHSNENCCVQHTQLHVQGNFKHFSLFYTIIRSCRFPFLFKEIKRFSFASENAQNVTFKLWLILWIFIAHRSSTRFVLNFQFSFKFVVVFICISLVFINFHLSTQWFIAEWHLLRPNGWKTFTFAKFSCCYCLICFFIFYLILFWYWTWCWSENS